MDRAEETKQAHQFIGNYSTSGIFNYGFSQPNVFPRLDVLETNTHVIYMLDISGIDTEKLNLEISKDEVAISAPIKTPAEANAIYIYQERPKGTYSRLLTAPKNVDTDNVEANYANGILEIKFPKKPARIPS